MTDVKAKLHSKPQPIKEFDELASSEELGPASCESD